MKTKEELATLKQEFEDLTTKLSELSEDELKEVASGFAETFGDKLKGGINDMPRIEKDERYVM